MELKDFNRFEYKYVIPLAVRDRLLREAEPFLIPDVHGEGGSGIYRVNSLYFDSDRLDSYRQKIDGERDRLKLRIRGYPDAPLAPMALELKIKKNRWVIKRRAFGQPDRIEALLRAPLASLEPELAKWAPEDHDLLRRIRLLLDTTGLSPKVLISYRRQALQDRWNPRVRITFDTSLRSRSTGLRLEALREKDAGKAFRSPSSCVMEVKFNGFCPRWLTHLLQRHDCRLEAVSKFCSGLESSRPRG